MRTKTVACSVLSLLLGVLTTGCGGRILKNEDSPKIIPVTQVLNKVKKELYEYAKTDPIRMVKKGVCTRNTQVIDLVPTQMTLTLSAGASIKEGKQAGIGVPIGPVTINAGGGNTRNSANSVDIIIPLAIVNQSIHERIILHNKWTRLTGASGPNTESKNKLLTLEKYPLAKAIASLRDSILDVDHDQTPCLKMSDKQIKFVIEFSLEEVGKNDFTFNIVPLKVSGNKSTSQGIHQKLVIDFKLVGYRR